MAGCPWVVRGDVPYCEEHAKQVAREREAGRPSAARRGYDGNWRKLRAMFLRRHPLCADPFGRHGGRPVVATEVDHIQPLSRGGGHEWDNLQALCRSCHSKKTARETGFTRG
jgi:5-methylcytosine-specific restriction protein A